MTIEELREKEFITVKEASIVFNFPVCTFKKWVQRKVLTEKNGYCHFGHAVRIDQAKFRAKFINARSLRLAPQRSKAAA